MPQPLSGIPVLRDIVLGTFGALGCAEIDIHSFSFPWRPRQSGDLCLPGPFGGPASFCDTSVPHPTPKRQPRLPAVFRRFCPRKPCFGNLLAPAHPLVYSLMLPYPPVFTRKYDKSRRTVKRLCCGFCCTYFTKLSQHYHICGSLLSAARAALCQAKAAPASFFGKYSF